ncbi:MAG: metallophosphoesterase, partial [Rickettsiales bacterium]|nr:metallophosphoesterase [Rickettsiales bacterium]
MEITPPAPRRIYAVSDMHIGAPYSGWSQHMRRVERGIAQADEVVLCGDMFEGTMMQSGVDYRIRICTNALKKFSAANPKARIHVLFGNHEVPLIAGGSPADAPYLKVADAIRECANGLPNVKVHDKGWVQIGDAAVALIFGEDNVRARDGSRQALDCPMRLSHRFGFGRKGYEDDR